MHIKHTLFLSSYSPLFAILGVRFDPDWLKYLFFGLAIVGAGGLAWIMFWNHRVTRSSREFTSVKLAGAEASSYLATYLLPFFTVSDPTGEDVFVYLLFFVMGWSIYIKSSMIQVNPVLFLAGYRVLAVEDRNRFSGFVITRHKVDAGLPAWCASLDDNVLVGYRDGSRIKGSSRGRGEYGTDNV